MVCLSRIGWISSCLCYAGRFGSAEKKALMQAFDVSESTISRDQGKLWSLLANDGTVELYKGKLVVRDQASLIFPEGMAMPSLSDWLEVMMGNRFAQVSGPGRSEPRGETIRAVVKAIRERKVLSINYLSKSAADAPRWRFVSPHALVQVAGRYHAFCWDHEASAVRDFVLTRIRAVIFGSSETPAYHALDPNGPWVSKCRLEVRLATGQPLSVARADYGLNEAGFATLNVPKALSPYVMSERRNGFEDLIEIIDPEGQS